MRAALRAQLQCAVRLRSAGAAASAHTAATAKGAARRGDASGTPCGSSASSPAAGLPCRTASASRHDRCPARSSAATGPGEEELPLVEATGVGGRVVADPQRPGPKGFLSDQGRERVDRCPHILAERLPDVVVDEIRVGIGAAVL